MSNRVYYTPLGLSSKRPNVDIPPIDHRVVMQDAHVIAARFRPYHPSYRAALIYGLKAAIERARVRQSFAMINAQVAPRALSAADIEASHRATRRVGSSFT